MTFGEKIAGIRKSAGLSQEQFGEMFGVSRQSVSKWESDQTLPELATMIKIADLFDVSVDYLLGRENLKTQDAEKVFKKTVQSNKQFKLGCILIVIGLALTCTLMYTQKDMIAYCGNPLKMLMMAGEWTDWLMYLLVLWPVFSGFGICWTAIYSKE